MFYVITNKGLLQPALGMEGYCVSKCLPFPENGMNIELFVVNHSDVDFRLLISVSAVSNFVSCSVNVVCEWLLPAWRHDKKSFIKKADYMKVGVKRVHCHM